MATDNNNPIKFVTDIESVRLTNFFIRVTWRTAAFAVTIITRIITAIVLAAIQSYRRNRRLP